MNLRRDNGAALCAQRMRALFVKRFIHSWRNRLLTTCQLLIPMTFALIALIIIKTLPNPSDSPPRVLDAKSLMHNTVPFSVVSDSTALSKDLGNNYQHYFDGLDQAHPRRVKHLERLDNFS